MRKLAEFKPNRCLQALIWGGGVIGIMMSVKLLCENGTTHAQTPSTVSLPSSLSEGQPTEEVQRAEGLSRAFRAAAKKALPAVVVIKAGPSPVCPRCGHAHHAEDADESLEGEGGKSLDVLGSGFIVSPTGVVLTNKHVVKGAQGLVVQTADGRQYSVIEFRTDKEQDAAVLRIDAKGPLPHVRLGNSDAVEIGDWVLTIGCPLELEQTVSAGIISAKNRSFCAKHPTRYLQTDAVVNPGSSGGPLVALSGEVIGITSSIASEDGGYQGIGFAVPVSLVRRLLEEFERENKLRNAGKK